MKIDRDAIRELAEILNDTGLTEIEIEEKDLKVRVSREVQQVAVQQPAYAPAPMAAAPVAVATESPVAVVSDASHPGALKSPMVGTAYHSPEPGAANFVNVGDKVNAGDTVMIIEAMKVMNPIKAEKGGTVTQILTDDASPVEFGDVLAIIE